MDWVGDRELWAPFDVTPLSSPLAQVHARLLVSESHFFIKEAYLSLLEAVCTIYVERRRRAGATHRALNVGLTETKRALQILAMVNKYQV